MKTTRFLFLVLALAAVVLALSACDLSGMLGGGTTTAPESTTAPTTTADPSAAVTTTAPAITTAPPAVTAPPVTAAPNPIKEVKVMSSGALQITLTDKVKLSLGTLTAREGYNSASVAHSLDKETGILTLTLTDSAARNVAADFVGAEKSTLTVRIRENNKKLEWAPADADTFTPFCDAKSVTGVVPLEKLAEATGFGKHTEVTGNGVVLAVDGQSLRFRAREWKEGTDFVMDCKLGGSSNKKFNISYLAEINASTDFGSVSTSTGAGYQTFKSAGDDITPINMNGTYIGANHGYYIIAAVPNPGNVMTEEDIGSIWRVDNQQYVLVRVNAYTKEAGASLLWFCPYYDSAMQTGRFDYRKITGGSTLTHVSGATHKNDIRVSVDSVQAQFYIAVNHYKEAAFLNGTVEVDLTKKGSYTAEFVDFYEEYDIVYLPTMLQQLIDNVGWNDDTDHYSDAIEDSYVTFRNTYRYHKNGACVVFSEYEFHKDVTIGYIGGVQSQPFSESTHYVYVPGTTHLATPTLQSNAQIDVGKNQLADPDRLVTSYFQFTDANGTKGMNLGFNPLYGTGVNDVRAPLIGGSADAQNSNLAFYYTSYKMYPRLIANCSLTAGTKITCVAYRLPSYVMDDDFTAINWYWVGDDIYLSLHTDKALDKTVTVLPEYMEGMTAEVIEGSTTFTVNSTVIDGGISVTSTDAGYAIIKLSPAN